MPERELKARVRLFVIDAFKKCNVDANNQARNVLEETMERCKANTEKMLGRKAEPIRKKHYREMSGIISMLPE